ncbi:HopJ type III effector protein [Polaribacter sp.]|uniref:HopJ type III effector protein n=1 Tax=Polaribacter sp. TaxID=1920175 RepID=UPI003F6966F2
MTIQSFKNKLKTSSNTILFKETIQVIDHHYVFTPTSFKNGIIKNNANENSGSCKLFAFAKLQGFTKEETLFCFGEHYKSVLTDKNGTSHQNIRNFIEFGFNGITFKTNPLQKKLSQ